MCEERTACEVNFLLGSKMLRYFLSLARFLTHPVFVGGRSNATEEVSQPDLLWEDVRQWSADTKIRKIILVVPRHELPPCFFSAVFCGKHVDLKDVGKDV